MTEQPIPLRSTEPIYASTLVILPEFFVRSAAPVPNRWRRFWYWALLGWRWERM